jgi:hypothetical protein
MKVGVVIPFLSGTLNAYVPSLTASLDNFKSAFEQLVIIAVEQNVLDSELDLKEYETYETLFPDFQFEHVLLSRPNVSKARNVGVDIARIRGCTHLVFHDLTLFYPLATLHYFKELPANTLGLVRPEFSEHANFEEQRQIEPNVKKVQVASLSPLKDTYVWCYFFTMNSVKRFDESIGPGASELYKSGEDTLMIADLVVANGEMTIHQSNELSVIHPPRPSDFSKHLLYAAGAGHVYARLIRIKKYREVIGLPYLLLQTSLFFGNAFFRCVLFKKNSLSILIRRINSFVYTFFSRTL